MTGRHFRPPPWRAVPASRLLTAVKDPGLPRPRHHIHGRARREALSFSWLGVGYAADGDGDLAAPYSRPTGCSPGLPDVRDAARDAGNSPAAGVLPASSHRLAPPWLVGAGGKPSLACRRSSPVSPPGSSSAGLTPPVSGPDQRPQLCGLAAAGGTPPSLSGARSTPATPRGSSFAGLRPPVHGTDPRLHLRGLAAGGRPPSLPPAGRHSPATLPRSSDTVRHAFQAGGSFRSSSHNLGRSASPVTGLRRVLPVCSPDARMATVLMSPGFCNSAPGMPRLFSTLPPPVEEVDLMVAEKTWTSNKLCPFEITRLSASEVKQSLKLDLATCDQYLDKGTKAFETMVKPALLPRCLLSPYTLSDPKGVQLHHAYKDIIKRHPRYMTALELTEDLRTLPAGSRGRFLDHLSEDRAIITGDLVNRLGASAGTTHYDHSVMSFSVSMSNDDDSVIYKGECDASYSDKTKEANLCIAIWCHDKVLKCILVEGFECKFGSVEAEATAMYILLKQGVLLGLHEKAFKACTDSDVAYQVLWGSHRIDHDKPTAELYKLLKFMRSYYKKLIPKHEPREKMMFVDGLMRVKEKDETNQILGVLRKLQLDHGGHLILKFTQKSRVTTKLASKKALIPLEVERSCYLKVEEKYKIDSAYHVISAMRPTKVSITLRANQSEEEKLFDLFEDCEIEVQRTGGNTMVTFRLDHRIFHKVSEKVLRVVLDDAVPVQECDDDSKFTVFLTSSNGIELQLPEFSPASFISFHQPPKRNGCSGMKGSEKHKADGSSFSMPRNDEEDNCK